MSIDTDTKQADTPGRPDRLTVKRLVLILILLILALAICSIIAISTGSERIGLADILKAITGSSSIAPEYITIIREIRLPRVLMAIVVGSALSVAGAAYQSILRNPLADPYILGVSTGAALGAILATVLAGSFPISRPMAAFIGAGITITVVYFIAQGPLGTSTERLVLSGVIVNAFLSSIVIFLLTALSDLRLRSIFSWLIGDLSGDPRELIPVAILVAIGFIIIYSQSRALNLMMVGEQDAFSLGVEVKRVKLIIYIAASLITGAAVAASGVIGFVGLIIPHGIRFATGSDNRLVIPASALAGAIFLLLGDTIARTVIAPRELHIGVVTSLIGAPLFIYLLRKAT